MKEALEMGAILKLHARRLQTAADYMAKSGDANASVLLGQSAAADTFADRLYAPFLDETEMGALNEQADKENHRVING